MNRPMTRLPALPRLSATRALPPVSLLLRALPGPLHGRALSLIGNFLMRGQSFAPALADLEGKRLALRITDSGRELHFHVRRGRLAPAADGAFDVRISGSTEDFLKLALREEDPDTLFFDRRLSLEGETEAGLYLKNLLDAVEFDVEAHARSVLGDRMGTQLAAAISRLPTLPVRLTR
jgi:predicted lipid carrier protein YhbT